MTTQILELLGQAVCIAILCIICWHRGYSIGYGEGRIEESEHAHKRAVRMRKAFWLTQE